MNELSTDIITHVVMTHSKMKYFITQKQYDALLELSSSGEKGVDIQGEFVAFSSIAEIPFVETYYERFPDQRPQPEMPQFVINNSISIAEIFHTADTDGKEKMIEGLQKFCSENPNSLKAEKLLKSFQIKLEQERRNNAKEE